MSLNNMEIFRKIDDGKNVYKHFLQACENGNMLSAPILFNIFTEATFKNFVREDGYCMALYMACNNGHLEMMKWIFSKIKASYFFDGREKVLENRENEIFQRSCFKGHLEIAKWVKTNSTKFCRYGIKRSFEEACSGGHLEIAKWLKEEFPDNITSSSVKDYDDDSLSYACRSGNLELVKWLKNSFNLTTEDARKRCNVALLNASEDGHTEVVKFLLFDRDGFHLTSKDIINNNAPDRYRYILQYPSEKGHLETVKILDEKLRSDYQIKDESYIYCMYECSLIKACEAGQIKVVEYLLDNAIIDKRIIKALLETLKDGKCPDIVDMIINKFNLSDNKKYKKDPLVKVLIDYVNRNSTENIVPEHILQRADEVRNIREDKFFYILEFASVKDYSELIKWIIENLIQHNCIDKILTLMSFGTPLIGQMLLFSCLNGNYDLSRWLIDTLKLDIKTILNRNRVFSKAVNEGNTKAIDCIIKIINPTEEEFKEMTKPYSTWRYTPEYRTIIALEWLQKKYNLEIKGEDKEPVKEFDKLIKSYMAMSFTRIKWLIETYNFSVEIIRKENNKLLRSSMEYTHYAKGSRRDNKEYSSLDETYSFIKWLVEKYGLTSEDFSQACQKMLENAWKPCRPKCKVKLDQSEYPGNWFAIKMNECGMLDLSAV